MCMFIINSCTSNSCLKYVQDEGGTIPCTVKAMRQLSCTDRPNKGYRQISFGAGI